MISAIIEFLRTLTDPEKLIALLTSTLTGWTGYLGLFCDRVCRDRFCWWGFLSG